MNNEEIENKLIESIAKFEHNPYGFVMFSFAWGKGALAKHKGPRKWQKKLLIEIGEKLKLGELSTHEVLQYAISSGHGIGKSAMVAWLILWALNTKVDTKGIVTANTDTQLKTKTWPELAKWHGLSISKHWFTFTATAIFSNDKAHAKTWRIDAIPWSEHNTEAFAGLHNEGKRILIIFDEASAIPDAIFEVTEGALTDADTEIIWCCFGNPTRNSGRFRECFRKLKKRWATYQIDARDVAGTNQAQIAKWLEDYKAEGGENSDFFKVRVRGIFPESSIKQFIPTKIVDMGYGKEIQKSSYDFAPVIITCDPAWTGDDKLVISMRQGNYFEILEVIPKNDDDFRIASLIAQYEDDLGASAVFIDMGYGTGIYSCGKVLKRKWTLVSFGGASTKLGFKNKRAEMWNDIKEWLKMGGCLPRNQTLYDDLISPESVMKTDGIQQLESKESIKARGIPSPDFADSLALSFAFPVKAKVNPKNKKRNSRSVAQGSWLG